MGACSIFFASIHILDDGVCVEAHTLDWIGWRMLL